MRLGAILGHLSPEPQPVSIADRAKQFVGEGFDSLWAFHAVGRGFMVPDPFVTLAVAATATEQVELGTATVQVPLYEPADLAHRILSLKDVCGDRLTLGVGAGSTEADFLTFERDYPGRFRAFNSNLARLRVLIGEGRDERADLDPGKTTAGRTRLVLGSWGAAVERAAREFDGWVASAYRKSTDEIIAALGAYRAAGGQRAMVSTIILKDRDDLGPTGEMLHRYAEAGFDDAIVMMVPGGPDPKAVRALLP